MDRRVTPPKRVTSPSWGPPHPCKQALRCVSFSQLHMMIYRNKSDRCPAILMSAKGSLGFLNSNSTNKIIQSSPALRTPRYLGQFSLSLGKESPY